MQETPVQFLGQENPLEKGMAIHSSILAWGIPWTEESGGLQSMWSQRVRHDWVTNTHLFNTFNNCNLLEHVKECILQIYYFWHIFPEVSCPFLVISGNLRRRKILCFPSTLVSTWWKLSRIVLIEWILCVRKCVMNKTEMVPVLMVLTSILLGLKCEVQLTRHQLHLP